MHASDSADWGSAQRRDVLTKGPYAPYFVYDLDADPVSEVPMVVASSCVAAVREASGGVRIDCSASISFDEAPCEDHVRDPWRLVALADARRLLVGRGPWPAGHATTHEEVWATLPGRVQAAVMMHWPALSDP